jgi:hypothetical protein
MNNTKTMSEDDDRSSFSNCSNDMEEGMEHCTSMTSTSTEKEDSMEPTPALAEKETALVFRLRLLVILALLSAAIAVSAVVFKITSDGENDEFESQFAGSASKILASFEAIVKEKIAAVGSLAVAATLHTIHNNVTWPFVTLDSFPERAAVAKSLSGAIFIGMLPVVVDENRDAWEKYAQDHFFEYCDDIIAYQNQIGISPFGDKVNPFLQTREELAAAYYGNKDDRQLQEDHHNISDLNFSSGLANHIYYTTPEGVDSYDPGPGYFIPIWQVSPFISSKWLNLNLNTRHGHTHRGRIDKAYDQQKIVMGDFSSAPPGDVYSDTGNFLTNLFATWLSFSAGEPVTYLGDPITNVYVPIFDSLGVERIPVGVVYAVIHWISFFTDVLPDNVWGVTLVLESPCTEPYTYTVNGPEVIPVGVGDLHDLSYDYLMQSASMEDFSSVSDGSQLGLELETEDCPFSIRVYPSKVFYQEYNTNTPIIITISVALIFVFTVVMFIIYDHLVEKRNRLV